MAVPRPVLGKTELTLASIEALCDAADAATAQLARLEQALADNQAAIGSEARTRQEAGAKEAQARADADTAEAQARSSAIGQEQKDRNTAIAQVAPDLGDRIGALGDSLREAVRVEMQARTSADEGEQQARVAGLKAQAKALADATSSLRQAVAESAAAVEADSDSKLFSALVAIATDVQQPALCPAAFTGTALGAVADTAPLAPAGIVSGPFGRAYRVAGAGLISPRAAILYDPDAVQVVQARFWRLADPTDPNNDAVDVGVQWLDADDRDAGRTVIRRLRGLATTDGPHTVTVRVPSLVGAVPPIRPPSNAISWRPYLSTYGSDGATAVQRLGTTDATFAGVFAPDVLALTARMGVIEGQVKLGFAEKLDGRCLTLPGDPTPRDIPVGTVRMVKNQAMGRISTWANDDGVMVDLGSLTT